METGPTAIERNDRLGQMFANENTLHIISELYRDISANCPQLDKIVLFPKVGKDVRPNLRWKYGLRGLAHRGRGLGCGWGRGHDDETLSDELDEASGKLLKQVEHWGKEVSLAMAPAHLVVLVRVCLRKAELSRATSDAKNLKQLEYGRR